MARENIRTDLALEARHLLPEGELPGVTCDTEEARAGVTLTRVAITTPQAARAMGKAAGRYVTLEAPALTLRDPELEEAVSRLLARELERLLPEPGREGPVLVVGLGNREITPDSLGPRVVAHTMVTRHLLAAAPGAVDGRVRPVCALAPGVLGVTGLETAEVVRGVAQRLRPAAVVAVDALASRDSRHIAATVQLSDTGIRPGSGVGNRRTGLDAQTLGCPVLALGVPTVVYAATIIRDALEKLEPSPGGAAADRQMEKLRGDLLQEMVVTPKEIDVLVEDAARRVALGLNLWIHKGITPEEAAAFLH